MTNTTPEGLAERLERRAKQEELTYGTAAERTLWGQAAQALRSSEEQRDRMRGALEKIEKIGRSRYSSTGLRNAYEAVLEIAREALAQPQEKQG